MLLVDVINGYEELLYTIIIYDSYVIYFINLIKGMSEQMKS